MITFEDGEFEGKHVASLHNHPKNMLSPPSSKNFGIFNRDFEDYEVIAGYDNFWILKGKGTHATLWHQLNWISQALAVSSLEYCCNRYGDSKIIDKMHDIRYGNELKYINNKNIKDIQLIKKEYITMSDNLKTIEFGHFKRVTDPEEIRLARERELDPNVLSGKDRIYAIYKTMGMEIDYDDIFAD